MNLKRKYVIKSKVRFTVFITLLIVSGAVFTGTCLGWNQASSLSPETYTPVEIQYGDTLWELAKVYGPSDADVRQVIHSICALNETTAETLRPGQTILIPTEL